MTIADFRCLDCPQKSCAMAVLKDSEVETLRGNVVEVAFEKGENLFRENALNAHVFYLKKGLVKIHVKVADNWDFIQKIVSAPSYLGLATVFGDRVNQYSATAIEPTSACCIDIEAFKGLIFKNSKFAYEIIADISKDELCSFRRYVNLTHKQSHGRLAGALLFFAEEVYHDNRFELPLTRKELAEMIGASRENVTRNLSQLKSEGILELDRQEVHILRPESLRSIYRSG